MMYSTENIPGTENAGSEFEGLVLENEFGKVNPPENIARVNFEGKEPVHINLYDHLDLEPGKEDYYRVDIDFNELEDLILEVDGNHIHMSGGRFFILVKIGNSHIPFYSSSKGTDGKNQGGWYPYFGMADYDVIRGNGEDEFNRDQQWIIKGGNIKPDGSMIYNNPDYSDHHNKVAGELEGIRQSLNKNLHAPWSTISRSGKVGPRGYNETVRLPEPEPYPEDVIFDFGEHFKIGNLPLEQGYEQVESNRKITGYNPSKVIGPSGKNSRTKEPSNSHLWIKSVLESIDLGDN